MVRGAASSEVRTRPLPCAHHSGAQPSPTAHDSASHPRPTAYDSGAYPPPTAYECRGSPSPNAHAWVSLEDVPEQLEVATVLVEMAGILPDPSHPHIKPPPHACHRRARRLPVSLIASWCGGVTQRGPSRIEAGWVKRILPGHVPPWVACYRCATLPRHCGACRHASPRHRKHGKKNQAHQNRDLTPPSSP